MMRDNNIVSDARTLLNGEADIGHRRPYLNERNEPCMMVFQGGDRFDENNYREIHVNAAALRYDEWRRLDEVVLKIAESRLVGYDDLRSRGLVYNLNNAMATTVLTWEQMSDAMEAAVSINPVRKVEGDTVVFQPQHIPIPIVHVDYDIGERLLLESRQHGNGLDTNNAERAARKVAEKLETMLFGSAATMVYGGGTIHSYISFPQKNTVALTKAWDESTMTPALIKDDIIAMKKALIADKRYGPYMVYIPTAYETILDDDYSVSGQSLKTIRERILEISKIEDIKVVDELAADTVLMVQLTSDCVDIVDGMGIQNIQWNSGDNFVHHYKVMTIQVPRIKSDYNGTSGVCVLA